MLFRVHKTGDQKRFLSWLPEVTNLFPHFKIVEIKVTVKDPNKPDTYHDFIYDKGEMK